MFESVGSEEQHRLLNRITYDREFREKVGEAVRSICSNRVDILDKEPVSLVYKGKKFKVRKIGD